MAVFAMQMNSRCYCDDDFGTPASLYPRLADDSCQMPATPRGWPPNHPAAEPGGGADCVLCGGVLANAIFLVVPLPPSPPALPPSPPAAPVIYNGHEFLGCFRDDRQRDLAVYIGRECAAADQNRHPRSRGC